MNAAVDPITIRAAVRRFPLLGRPRPACPALSDRVAEVAEIAKMAAAQNDNGMAEAAHALNKAALIASDCALPDLARQWCWRHINIYRRRDSLTALQASYLLEPVLNLARLQIRADNGRPALHLLTAMCEAVTAGTNLVVDGRTLPLTNLTGTRDELGKLRQWAWLQHLSEGIRVLALTGRWDDAVEHATTLNGIGNHLMEGRQAAIIAHLLHEDTEAASAILDDTTITQPWEQQVDACLKTMCATPETLGQQVSAMVEHFLAHKPIAGYAVYRVRWGLTAAVLSSEHDEAMAQHLLRHLADEVLDAPDGYAAREVLGHRTALHLGKPHEQALTHVVIAAGLGAGTMPEATFRALHDAVEIATDVLTSAVGG
ncbi:hypothetical protein ACFFMR_30875 [Micromonospora andamanensis]|uniref:XRE family transcriptional regulator n=1 Tax=Micromonospora andamanensis TaxID=1287068 RepID=A0ABQ4I4D8_9ACTN|nr:hypothetical protein [Micromonospora andamanensis]GIJ12738.1 hypothetical protein Van01_59520 [Micromonospora andamanensis]